MTHPISRFNLYTILELNENLHFIQFYFQKFDTTLLKHLQFVGFYDIKKLSESESHILVSKFEVSTSELPKAVAIPQKRYAARPFREMNNGVYFPVSKGGNEIHVYRGYKPFPKAGHGTHEIWKLNNNSYELVGSKTTWIS